MKDEGYPIRHASVNAGHMTSDEFRPAPKINPDTKIDFSGFHPLDHWPWQCGDLPGGWRTHLRYAWDFRREPELKAATLCRIGRHDPSQWWSRNMTWIACRNCGKKLSQPQPE